MNEEADFRAGADDVLCRRSAAWFGCADALSGGTGILLLGGLAFVAGALAGVLGGALILIDILRWVFTRLNAMFERHDRS